MPSTTCYIIWSHRIFTCVWLCSYVDLWSWCWCWQSVIIEYNLYILFCVMILCSVLHPIICLWRHHFQLIAPSKQHLFQSSCCTSVWCESLPVFIIGLSRYSSPPPRAWRGAEKTEPPCFSSLEVSGWLKRWEVEVNQPLTLGLMLSFTACFNQ